MKFIIEKNKEKLYFIALRINTAYVVNFLEKNSSFNIDLNLYGIYQISRETGIDEHTLITQTMLYDGMITEKLIHALKIEPAMSFTSRKKALKFINDYLIPSFVMKKLT